MQHALCLLGFVWHWNGLLWRCHWLVKVGVVWNWNWCLLDIIKNKKAFINGVCLLKFVMCIFEMFLHGFHLQMTHSRSAVSLWWWWCCKVQFTSQAQYYNFYIKISKAASDLCSMFIQYGRHISLQKIIIPKIDTFTICSMVNVGLCMIHCYTTYIGTILSVCQSVDSSVSSSVCLAIYHNSVSTSYPSNLNWSFSNLEQL